MTNFFDKLMKIKDSEAFLKKIVTHPDGLSKAIKADEKNNYKKFDLVADRAMSIKKKNPKLYNRVHEWGISAETDYPGGK
jgi:hypothetical protein